MDIARANPSLVVKGIRWISNLEPLAPMLHAAKSFYYSKIGGIQNSDETKNAWDYFETVQKIFSIITLICIKNESQEIASLLGKKWAVSLVVAGGSFVVACFVLNTYFKRALLHKCLVDINSPYPHSS